MTIGKKAKKSIIILIGVLALLIAYKLNPYRLQFIGHYDKIGAHRINSTEKLSSALKYFNSVELDLVYDSDMKRFDVNHPPATSIGLDLETYLSKIEIDEKPYLWLDIKNLDLETVEGVYLRIIHLIEKNKYPKEKILIETRYPEALPKFTEYGFKTSYYLNYKIQQMDENLLEKEVAHINSILEKQPNIAISSSYLDYDFMTKYFPNKEKCIWVLTPRFHFDFFEIRTILKDPTVKNVLVRYHASQGNR